MKSVKSQVRRAAVPDVGRCRTLKLRYRSYDRPPKADKRRRTAPRDAHWPGPAVPAELPSEKRLRTAPPGRTLVGMNPRPDPGHVHKRHGAPGAVTVLRA